MADEEEQQQEDETPSRVPLVRVPVLNPEPGEEPFMASADVASQWDFRDWGRA